MREFIDVTGKTEDEAICKALAQLGLDRDDVSVEILERAKIRLFGLGSCPAKVRVSYGPEEEEPAAPSRRNSPRRRAPEPPQRKAPAPQGTGKRRKNALLARAGGKGSRPEQARHDPPVDLGVGSERREGPGHPEVPLRTARADGEPCGDARSTCRRRAATR